MFEVTVTEDHIKRGVARQCSACPVALAVKDCPGNEGANVSVHLQYIYVVMPESQSKPPSKVVRYNIPYRVSQWIREFDEYRTGEPFTFQAYPRV